MTSRLSNEDKRQARQQTCGGLEERVPQAGLKPVTYCLRGRRSTTELARQLSSPGGVKATHSALRELESLLLERKTFYH